MEIATGYFISRAPAIEAARFFGRQGYKIEVLGNQNQEDFRERQISNDFEKDLEAPYYGFTGGDLGGASGINGYLIAGSGPLMAARPIVSLANGGIGSDFNDIMTNWGIPRDIENEIKAVIDSGRSVLLVECESTDRDKVREALIKQGAQNIHI